MPVAGFGTRLRPQTWSKPKPLVPVAGKPMLAHVLDRLLPLDPDQVVFITGFLGNQVEEFFTSNYDVPSAFIEQPQMLGQTDAIARARDVATGSGLILFPDMLFETDFSVIDTTDADVIAFTKDVDDPSAYGIAIEEAGRVTRIIEKPQDPISNQAVVGIYFVRNMPDLYDAIDEQIEKGISLKNEYFLADAIQIMIDRGKKVVTAPVSEWWDCGTEQALLDTNRRLLESLQPVNEIAHDVAVIAPSYIHPDAVVERSVIGPFASIGKGASVTGSVVTDSIVDENGVVRDAVLDHSIIGRGARVAGSQQRLNLGDGSVLDKSS